MILQIPKRSFEKRNHTFVFFMIEETHNLKHWKSEEIFPRVTACIPIIEWSFAHSFLTATVEEIRFDKSENISLNFINLSTERLSGTGTYKTEHLYNFPDNTQHICQRNPVLLD